MRSRASTASVALSSVLLYSPETDPMGFLAGKLTFGR
jgi:hypothetical protein